MPPKKKNDSKNYKKVHALEKKAVVSEKKAVSKIAEAKSIPKILRHKKNVSGASKKSIDSEKEALSQVVNDSTTPKISTFFKAAAKPVCKKNAETNVNSGSDSRHYYVEALKKTLASNSELEKFEKEIEFTSESVNGATEEENEAAIGALSTQIGTTEEQKEIEFTSEPVNGATEEENEAAIGALSTQIGTTEEENEVNIGVVSNENSEDVSNTQITCTGCMRKSHELMVYEMKYKEIHKRYTKLSIYCSELQLKYEDLLKTGTRTVQPDIMNEAVTDPLTADIFSSAEIKMLEGIPLDKSRDSTFILQCLRFAYQANISVLRYKTAVKGKHASITYEEEIDKFTDEKYRLTPEKVSRIRQLFMERLDKCKINSVDYGNRIKNAKVHQLLNSGIKNIARQLPSNNEMQ